MSFDQKPEQTTDQLTFSVGERSFDAESAATKIQNADQHISTIEAENQGYKERLAALEAQVAQSTKIDDALAKLQNQQVPQENQPSGVTAPVSEEQIGEIAIKKMQEQLAAQQEEASRKAAETLAESTYRETGEKLTAFYGDKTDDAMAAKAKELGISNQAIFDMAKNPVTAKLLLESMKISPSAPQSAPSGSFNTASIHNNAPERHMDYSKKPTSSTILEALKKSGGTYN